MWNCNHNWGDHEHLLVTKEIPDLSFLGLDAQGTVEACTAPEVNNCAALTRGEGDNDTTVL
jgi:hypothetical protein